MSYEFEKLIQERRLIKGKITSEMISAELKSAEYDLGRAKASFKAGDFKWATVEAYYSMFHAVRALVYSRGYREKSHYALMVAFKELFVDAVVLEKKYHEYFADAMSLREGADYRSEYGEGGASETIENAEDMFGKSRQILRK